MQLINVAFSLLTENANLESTKQSLIALLRIDEIWSLQLIDYLFYWFLRRKYFAFFAEKWGISVFLAGFCVSFSRNCSYRCSEKNTFSLQCRILSLRNTCGIIVSKHFFRFHRRFFLFCIFVPVLLFWDQFTPSKSYISVANIETFSINMELIKPFLNTYETFKSDELIELSKYLKNSAWRTIVKNSL